MQQPAKTQKKLAGQLEIEVAPAPGAVGRWDRDHEIAAYRRTMGEHAASRQQQAAEKAKDCTCGKQDEADAKAREEGKPTKKLLGHQHKPGCNSFRKLSQSSPRLSMSEQAHRYRAEQLRAALDRSRQRELERSENDAVSVPDQESVGSPGPDGGAS